MNRGELYRVPHPSKTDPKKSSVCFGLFSVPWSAVQIEVGIDEGLKHPSSIHCDELVSLPKSALTDYVGSHSQLKLEQLNWALAKALGLSEGTS